MNGLRSFQVLNLIILALGLLTSYLTFFLHGRWEFGGFSQLNPLESLHLRDYRAMGLHVVLTLLWVTAAHYNIATQGTGAHAWVGRASIFIGSVMWIVAPESQQMSSCWPVDYFGRKLSSDAAAVLSLISIFSLCLILGWISILSKPTHQNFENHKLYMCLATWSSASPALMRILIFFPGLYFASQRPASQHTLLTLGQWLMIKEATYCILTFLQIIPFFNPKWSPFAKMAINSDSKFIQITFTRILSCCFLAFMGYRLIMAVERASRYTFEIGFFGGEKCDVFLEKFWPSVIKNFTL